LSRIRVLYIEPFEAGSHATFTRRLCETVDAEWTTLTLPGRYWKWRARGSAVYFALANRDILEGDYDLLWAGSFLNLADLLALCPKLQEIPRVLYFHENQLAYPVRPEFVREGDNHFGISQMVSSLAATHCVFNSVWNRDSFLEEAARLLGQMPDRKPPEWIEQIRARSTVLGVPLDLPALESVKPLFPRGAVDEGPIILWNHRWEHDKAPEVFFETLMRLKSEGVSYRLIVCGERYRRAPPVFETARHALSDRILHWGFLDSRSDYEGALMSADIAVSVARHEFFGISMLEAAHFGARPVVPDRLSYRELFPREHRYSSDEDLVTVLRGLCTSWSDGLALRGDYSAVVDPFGDRLIQRYQSFIEEARQVSPRS